VCSNLLSETLLTELHIHTGMYTYRNGYFINKKTKTKIGKNSKCIGIYIVEVVTNVMI